MDIFNLINNWFEFCFENPHKINTNHSALYFFILSHCNRLGWKDVIGLPTEMTKEAIGIKNYRTYYTTFNDLVNFGFIEVKEKSKNQYSSNIIAIVKNTKAPTKAPTKAIDKARSKHLQKHCIHNNTIYNIQDTIYNDELFVKFFDDYHLITKIKKTDKLATEKYWKKLTDIEKKKAHENILNYYNSINDKKYVKKCRTYLSDKNFNDEFNSEIKNNELQVTIINDGGKAYLQKLSKQNFL